MLVRMHKSNDPCRNELEGEVDAVLGLADQHESAVPSEDVYRVLERRGNVVDHKTSCESGIKI